MVVDLEIVDLGAAPGWSQYAARYLQGKGRIIASDILAMDPISGLNSCRAISPWTTYLPSCWNFWAINGQLVMSDMAPNMSGIAEVDHDRGVYLIELSLDFSEKTLAPGGDYLVKVFQGRDYQPFVQRLRGCFAR